MKLIIQFYLWQITEDLILQNLGNIINA
uniref:Uncharacterized protein n=1 Tax=Lepeophtheirus salmonis TaxID=72036 RepID=A0A0K2UD00_LEPSM